MQTLVLVAALAALAVASAGYIGSPYYSSYSLRSSPYVYSSLYSPYTYSSGYYSPYAYSGGLGYGGYGGYGSYLYR